MGIVGGGVAQDLAANPSTPGSRSVPVLQNQDGGSLAHDKSVPLAIEGPASPRWILISLGHRADQGERSIRQGGKRTLDSAGEGNIGASRANQVKRLTNRNRARSARVGVADR